MPGILEYQKQRHNLELEDNNDGRFHIDQKEKIRLHRQIYQCIYETMFLSIYVSMFLSIYVSIDLFIYVSIYL